MSTASIKITILETETISRTTEGILTKFDENDSCIEVFQSYATNHPRWLPLVEITNMKMAKSQSRNIVT